MAPRQTTRILALRWRERPSRCASANRQYKILPPRGNTNHRDSPMILGKKPPTSTKPQSTTRTPIKEQWHAISIVAGPAACPAAVKLGGRRFLSDEAPRLPLGECSSPARCKCIYRHFSDRRASLRRAEERIGLIKPWSGVERRGARGRRDDDS